MIKNVFSILVCNILIILFYKHFCVYFCWMNEDSCFNFKKNKISITYLCYTNKKLVMISYTVIVNWNDRWGHYSCINQHIISNSGKFRSFWVENCFHKILDTYEYYCLATHQSIQKMFLYQIILLLYSTNMNLWSITE